MGCCSSKSKGNPRSQSKSMGSCSETRNSRAPSASDPPLGCVESEQDKEEIPQLQHVSSSSRPTDENEEMIIATIRATDVALGLRRLPAGFYAVLHHDGLAWRTESLSLSVNDDTVEWSGPIPIPSDLSATVHLEVYASFEFDHILGVGEQLRRLTVTMEQLLDHSIKGAPFSFFPKDGDVVSPCSSILVTVKRQKRENKDSSASRVLNPCCSTPEFQGELEEATNQGRSALSRYRKYGEKPDLERSIQQFERALNICPLDHPCRATAQSNLGMAKLILCQVESSNASLEVPLRMYRDALAARPVGHRDRPSTLIQLAVVHLAQFQKRPDLFEEAQAEALLREAIKLCPADSHEKRAATFMLQLHAGRRLSAVQPGGLLSMEQESTSCLTGEDPRILSVQLLEHFERSGDLTSLERVIAILEGLVKYISVSDNWYCTGLANLGMALLYRYHHLGEPSDLENAISTLKVADDLTPDSHPQKHVRLNNLGNSYRARFERLGELSDLEAAISTLKDADGLTPRSHPHKPTCLNSLGTSFRARFERLGELDDLKAAISTFKSAVDITPPGHPDKPARLNNLGISFVSRFKRLGELADLEAAISMLKDVAVLTPDCHLDKHTYLSNLGATLTIRFKCLGDLSGLEDSISALRAAVCLTPFGHPDKSIRLNNLGTSLITRFQRLGELKDLEDAISTFGDAVGSTPLGHPDRLTRLNNLGTSFLTRFERLGELSDIEYAISRQKDAVDLTPHDHPAKPMYLSNLGNSFRARFECIGELSDLEDTISTLREAVNLTPHDHLDKPHRLNNLASSLLTRFKRVEWLSDLEKAISMFQDAVDLSPLGHPHRPICLNNLGTAFRTRFKHLGKLRDLEDAISTVEDAIGLTPHGHPDKPDRLSNLGSFLLARFEYLGRLGDLESAISALRDAAGLTPHGHPHKPGCLYALGNALSLRFERLEELNNLEQAISLFAHAASSPNARIDIRFSAVQNWISCARRICHHSLLHAHSVALGLLPQLAWIGLSLEHRFFELRGVDEVREAAAAALDAGLPEIAVEWLEQGRSIVWGELLQLRSSYEELSSAHPDHASRLQELSAALDHAGGAREKSLSALSEQTRGFASHSAGALQRGADRHRMLAIERDKLLHEIRRLPGFEQFLLRKAFSRLRASAHSGPVVILNAAEARCDALIVLADLDHVIHVPLPNLTLKRCGDLQNILKNFVRHAREGKIAPVDEVNWESFLSPLWKSVVKPVLDALALSTPGNLSRIFWCPTGPLAFLPIHAAGFYDDQHSEPGHRVFDFVVSSYVPTLGILLEPSHPNSASTRGDLRLLVVGQHPSDGQFPLPGVTIELDYIKDVIRNLPWARISLLESSSGTVEEVLDLMREADWVHFACHGIQDVANSGLCLAHGRRLKLRDMIALSRPRSSGGLAFLSACQTATGEKRLSDEAVHVAAGMLFAGYRGVVGTMWSISDRLAPVVAREVYGRLFTATRTRPDYRGAAWALHEAVGRLRDGGESFVDWVPFIHVGL